MDLECNLQWLRSSESGLGLRFYSAGTGLQCHATSPLPPQTIDVQSQGVRDGSRKKRQCLRFWGLGFKGLALGVEDYRSRRPALSSVGFCSSHLDYV